MRLIVGLGNPGDRYTLTRHNVGFMALDRLASRHGIAINQKGFHSLYGAGKVGESRVTLVKPQTFMNRSGGSIRELAAYFRIPPSDILVIHDDIDLPFGKLRIRAGGGSGGHRGMGSIISELGTDSFPRVKIGIGRPESGDVSDYVLDRFSGDERALVERVLDVTVDAVEVILVSGIKEAMDRFNTVNDKIICQSNGGE